MGHSSRRAHWESFLSKNRKLGVHQVWQQIGEMLPDLMSPNFYCNTGTVGSEFGVNNKSIDPSCLASTIQTAGGGVMVCGIFSCQTLSPLLPAGHELMIQSSEHCW